MGLINSALDDLKAIYMYRKGKLNYEWVDLNITGGCTYDCIFCECQQLDHKSDLTTNEIMHLGEQMAEEKIFNIFIGGGEPLVRKDILQILQHFHSLKINVSMITNGSLPNRLTPELLKVIDKTVDEISISLDSAIPEEYNMLRGSKKAYDLAIETMKKLSGLSSTGKTVTAVITRHNFKNLHKLFPLAREYNFNNVVFQPMSDASNYPELKVKAGKTNLCLSLQENNEARDTFKKICEAAEQTGIGTNAAGLQTWVHQYFENREKKKIFYSNMVDKFKCIIAFKRISIRHNGDVQLCALLPSYTNIRKKSLKNVINDFNQAKENLRKGILHESCFKCFCGLNANVRFSMVASPISNRKYLKSLIVSKFKKTG